MCNTTVLQTTTYEENKIRKKTEWFNFYSILISLLTIIAMFSTMEDL